MMMKSLPLLLAATASLLSVTANAHPRPPVNGSNGKGNSALYFLDSDPKGASVVSLKIDGNGKISSPIRTLTGGNGLISNNADGPVPDDSLFSQDSIIVNGNHLFTVNAGSNTLASFMIPQNDPQHPVLVGQPVSTGGDTPVAVAFSPKNRMACVANTGTKAGVQCFSVSKCGALTPLGGLMPLNLNQTVPPTGPPNTVSDIVFNPSETAVFMTVKGNGKGLGLIQAYPVANGKLTSTVPVVSQPDGLLIDFSMSFISDSSALITDPAYGASFVAIDKDYKVTVAQKVEIAGQKTTCWSVFSKELDSVFVFDVTTPNITVLDTVTMQPSSVIPGNPEGKGAFDSILGGSMLYTLQASPAISVVDVGTDQCNSTAKVVQYLDLSSLGSRQGWIGMAIYPGNMK